MEQTGPDINRRERVYALLDRLGIEYGTVEHPPIFTRADSELRPVQTDAVIFKNLFLRNKEKNRYYLYSLPLDKRADLAALAKVLGETRLSFGDEDALRDKLNIRRGAVSFLNVADVENTDVIVLIDSSAFFCGRIGVHPNDNTATVILNPCDIEKILNACGAAYKFVTAEDVAGELVIGKAFPEDIPDILRVQYAAYQSEALLNNNFTIQPLTQTAEQVLSEFKLGVVLKAVKNDKIVGSVRGYEKNGVAYIGKLIVLPGYRNAGIGKRLLQSIENEFHCGRYELFTGSQSVKNISFYEKNGYYGFKTEETAPGLSLLFLEKFTTGAY